MRQFSFCFREIQDHVSAAIAQRPLPELLKFSCGLIIEIAARHLRVAISLASDEAANVSAIFTEQCLWFIFRMALHENRKTIPLLDEDIGTYLRQLRDDAIVSRNEFLLG